MSFDWLSSISKSLSARIEGRNVAVAVTLLFCAFGLWDLVNSYERHPALSWVFGSLLLALAGLVIVAVFFLKPQPSEVTQRFLHINQKLISVGGMQSQEELIEFIRHAHNIRDLPAPSALIKGSASNPSDYHDLSPADAAEIAAKDRHEVNALLQEELEKISVSVAGTIGSHNQIGAQSPSVTRSLTDRSGAGNV